MRGACFRRFCRVLGRIRHECSVLLPALCPTNCERASPLSPKTSKCSEDSCGRDMRLCRWCCTCSSNVPNPDLCIGKNMVKILTYSTYTQTHGQQSSETWSTIITNDIRVPVSSLEDHGACLPVNLAPNLIQIRWISTHLLLIC
jgi:hypothetical protein